VAVVIVAAYAALLSNIKKYGARKANSAGLKRKSLAGS